MPIDKILAALVEYLGTAAETELNKGTCLNVAGTPTIADVIYNNLIALFLSRRDR
jgi:hypothetical protein